MSTFVKVEYQAGVTKITAKNLNDIQNELIKLRADINKNSNSSPTVTQAKDVTFVTPQNMHSANVQSAIEELSAGAIKTVNSNKVTGGNIDISLNKTDNSITFSAANNVYGTLDLMTNQQVQEIKKLFV